MQYTDYISQYNAQIERQAQLIEKYSQRPVLPQNRFIWHNNTVERVSKHRINMSEALGVFGCVLVVGVILWLSVVLG